MVDVQLNDELIAKAAVTAKKTITLPSGLVATVRKGKGRDLMHAQRATGVTEVAPMLLALVAELCEIDGKKIVYEQELEMDLEDVLTLQGLIFESAVNFLVP